MIGSALALAAALCAALVGISDPANADSDRITQGEAAAVYQAAGAGGGAILSRGHGRFVGAPANQNVAIRPYFDNNLHYCADDWHALVLAYIVDRPTMQAARAALDPIVFTFRLDGRPLATERTQVKPFLNANVLGPDIPVAYSFQQGVLLAPSALTVGSHTVELTSVNPEDPIDDFRLKSKFVVDAAGTGTCV
jgi:hypothetical protein